MIRDPRYNDKLPADAGAPKRVNPRPDPKAATPGKKPGQSPLSRRLVRNLLVLIVGIMAALPGLGALPALGAEEPAPAAAQEPELSQGPLDYDRAARLAIRRSPYFTKGSLEIDVKRLDETDSRYDLIPSVNFRTSYYVDRPQQFGISKNTYSLRFTSEHYNPMESYYTLQAKKLFTQVAVLHHMQAIGDGLQRLGKLFLEMDCLKQVAARQQDLLDVARQNLTYVQNRLNIGTATSLEVKVATQELEAAQMEMERLTFSQNRLRGNLQAFIGLKSDQGTNLNLKEARQQLVGRFDPVSVTLEQTKTRSFELKIMDVKKELQKFNITVAKVKLLPSFFFGAVTADPLSLIQSRALFFYIGLDVPVWDGFKRLRNISRQKTVLKQYDSDSNLKVLDLVDKWNETQENLRSAGAARKAAQAQEELARLRERQSEIRYQSGGEPLSVYLEGRKGLLEAQKSGLVKALDYDLAVLALRQFSGDLGASYVDPNSWQQ